ncbi:MAG: aminofutalosine synthase MqnE [Deferribacteres bacterium]|nr:aminofutalosine synthase MqnE [Deferribacteres bacterium]
MWEAFSLQRLESLVSDKNLVELYEKLERGFPLSLEDGLYLYETDDIFGLAAIANRWCERLNGNFVFFVVNRHINPTNYCVNRCAFCAFSKTRGEPGGYELTLSEILDKAKEAASEGAREFHIVGGLHPDWPYEYYIEIVRLLKENFPHIHIKAYTAVEIDYFSRISGKSVEDVLAELKNAGLDSMPGGGAEIFNEEIRKVLCPEKISSERWLEIHRTAHKLGIKTNCTMLYGHLESLKDRVEHLIALRKLQEETGGFQAFVPLSFHPENTAVCVEPATGVDDLKTIAVSRLVLHNVPHIKAYWIMLGEGIAQLALLFGADDLEGTVYEEKITHSAGATSPQGLTKKRLLKMIKDVGKIPVERDALYNRIRVYE